MKREYIAMLLRSERIALAMLAVAIAASGLAIGAATTARSQGYQIQRIEFVRTPAEAPAVPAIPDPISADPKDDLHMQLLAEHRCLAEVMYYEARGEGEEGEKAVAEVVLHRIAAGDHGRTICAVVYEGARRGECQFTFACDGARDIRKSPVDWHEAQVLAARILTGEVQLRDETSGATYYHAITVRPNWAPQLVRTAQIGKHVFYREPLSATMIAVNSLRGSVW